MESHIYTKQSGRFVLPQFQILGVILLIVGIALAYQLNPFSILMLLIGTPLSSLATGVQINFRKKIYRTYIRILGFKYGKWVTIPAIDYVTVFVGHYSQDMGVASISKTDNYSDFKINLIVSKTQRFDAGGFNNKPEALKTAENIAREIGVKLLDFTSLELRWVEL